MDPDLPEKHCDGPARYHEVEYSEKIAEPEWHRMHAGYKWFEAPHIEANAEPGKPEFLSERRMPRVGLVSGHAVERMWQVQVEGHNWRRKRLTEVQ